MLKGIAHYLSLFTSIIIDLLERLKNWSLTIAWVSVLYELFKLYCNILIMVFMRQNLLTNLVVGSNYNIKGQYIYLFLKLYIG